MCTPHQGLEPEIRAEVWPLLLGVYSPEHSAEQRAAAYSELRRRYEGLMQRCRVRGAW